MHKIEAKTLESAYADAAVALNCSITELEIEVVQQPSKGLFGLFSKNAIIVVRRLEAEVTVVPTPVVEETVDTETPIKVSPVKAPVKEKKETVQVPQHRTLNETILPASFVTDQEDEDEQNDYIEDAIEGMFDEDEPYEDDLPNMDEIVEEVKAEINTLFSKTCFELNVIEVSVYDENTLVLEFNGADAALLIGKEGYRYKALSYMIFNWINARYGLQLRLEIAEFLKNQEESITRYLVGVCDDIERSGKAQTKILDGVLVQIALKQLRAQYPDKYVAIRSTRDGGKFIIINGYNNY